MRTVIGFVSLIVAGSMCSALLGAGTDVKLRGELARIVDETQADKLIPIVIVMLDQVAPGDLAQASGINNKQMRRASVISLLKNQAQISQQGVLRQLAVEQKTGEVGPRVRPLWIHSAVATRASAGAIARIAQRDDVAWISSDAPKKLGITPIEPVEGEPLPVGEIECGVNVMRAPEVWNDLGITGEGVVVAILDSGACITHPDLVNQIWDNVDEIPDNGIDDDRNGYIDDMTGWNFAIGNNNVGDTFGHGTHTTGTVAGDGTNGTTTGMAPDVAMMILKTSAAPSAESLTWEAMQYSVDNGAAIISGSVGWFSAEADRAMWRSVCENTIAAGVVCIFAAGNFGCNSPPVNLIVPGDVPEVITIGATDCDDNSASFSSCGPVTWDDVPPWNDCEYPPGCMKPTVSAPGVNTISTQMDCVGYEILSGTSMATPHVGGAVALMLQANPSLDHYQVKEILQQTAVDLGDPGMDNQFGAGRVDAYEAVLLALDLLDFTATPSDFNAFRGFYAAGDLNSLLANDGDRLCYNPGIVLSPTEAPITLDFLGTLPDDSPASLDVTIESSANTVGLEVTFSFWNYNTNSWDVVGTDTQSLNVDTVRTFAGNPADHVELDTGEVRTRYEVRAVSFIFVFPWLDCVDRVFWTISN